MRETWQRRWTGRRCAIGGPTPTPSGRSCGAKPPCWGWPATRRWSRSSRPTTTAASWSPGSAPGVTLDRRAPTRARGGGCGALAGAAADAWPISTPSGWSTAISGPPASGSTIVGTRCSTGSTRPAWPARTAAAVRRCGRRPTWRPWPPWPPAARPPSRTTSADPSGASDRPPPADAGREPTAGPGPELTAVLAAGQAGGWPPARRLARALDAELARAAGDGAEAVLGRIRHPIAEPEPDPTPSPTCARSTSRGGPIDPSTRRRHREHPSRRPQVLAVALAMVGRHGPGLGRVAGGGPPQSARPWPPGRRRSCRSRAPATGSAGPATRSRWAAGAVAARGPSCCGRAPATCSPSTAGPEPGHDLVARRRRPRGPRVPAGGHPPAERLRWPVGHRRPAAPASTLDGR